MSKKQYRREKMQAKRRRKQLLSRTIWEGIGIIIIVLFGAMIWNSPLQKQSHVSAKLRLVKNRLE